MPSNYASEAITILDKIPGTGEAAATVTQVKGWLVKNLLENQMSANIRPTLAKAEMDSSKLQEYTDLAEYLFSAESAAAVKVEVSAKGSQVATIKPAGGEHGGKKSGGSSGGKKKLVDGLCPTHKRFSEDAYTCTNDQCKMKGKLKPMPKVAEVTSD